MQNKNLFVDSYFLQNKLWGPEPRFKRKVRSFANLEHWQSFSEAAFKIWLRKMRDHISPMMRRKREMCCRCDNGASFVLIMAKDECVVKHFPKHGGNFSISIRIIPICATRHYYFNQPEKNYYEDNDVVIDKNYNDDADADADADADNDNDNHDDDGDGRVLIVMTSL